MSKKVKVARGHREVSEVKRVIKNWKASTEELFRVLGFTKSESVLMFRKMFTGETFDLDEEVSNPISNKKLEKIFEKILLD